MVEPPTAPVRKCPLPPALDSINQSVLDLDVTAFNKQTNNQQFVTALCAGETTLVMNFGQLEKINNTRQTTIELYDC